MIIELVLTDQVLFVDDDDALEHQLIVAFSDGIAKKLNDGHFFLESYEADFLPKFYDQVFQISLSHYNKLVF